MNSWESLKTDLHSSLMAPEQGVSCKDVSLL